MNRRDILKSAAALATWSGFWSLRAGAESPTDEASRAIPAPGDPESRSKGNAAETRKGDMIYRTLGRTGEQVSAIGLGGFHIGSIDSEKDAVRLIRTAIDRGVTFLDNSWDYHEGKSERWVGKAVKDGYREKVFLMTKLDGRTRELAAKQIDDSLKRFGVDHIDLMQIHEVIRLEDPDRCFAEGGAIQALQAARKAGKIRYIGFTGHKDPVVHNRMLDVADQHGFKFDTVQMPINVLDATFRSFSERIVPRLIRDGIGVLGMKPMASGAIVKAKIASPQECLRYALTLPTSVVITGVDKMEVLEQDLAVVRDFKPLAGEEMADLLTRTAPAAATGRHEAFKTTSEFDSTAHNPQWLG